MFNDHLLRTLSRTRVDDARRTAHHRQFEARGGPARRLAAVAPDAPLTIRHAGESDLPALADLAALDARRIPSGELFVAEVEGRLLAAVSIDTGAVVADPFRHTDSIVKLLRLQASAEAAPAPRPVALPEDEPALSKAA